MNLCALLLPVWLPAPALGNVFFAFRESDLAGKAIVAILFGGSIIAWSIMITKYRDLGRTDVASRRFLEAYRAEGGGLALFLGDKTVPECPHALIYNTACEWLQLDFARMGGSLDAHPTLSEERRRGARAAAERTLADMALELEDQMGMLATTVTAAPFLGLLGTVWGVMVAFAGMVASGSALLSAVAPGIAGALLTTVVGLLVALPSSIGYNLLSSRIRKLSIGMENFQEEFLSDIERVPAPPSP